MNNTIYLIALSQYQRGYEIIDQLEKTDYPDRLKLSEEKKRLKQEYIMSYTWYHCFAWRSFQTLPVRLQKELKTK